MGAPVPGFIPEECFPVNMYTPTSTSGGWTTDYIALNNAVYAWIFVHYNVTSAHGTLITPLRATTISGGVVLTTAVPIWWGNTTTSTNAIARVTDAVNYTFSGSLTGNHYLIFGIDPTQLGDGYDFIALTVAASSQANLMGVTAFIKPKFAVPVAKMPDFLA